MAVVVVFLVVVAVIVVALARGNRHVHGIWVLSILELMTLIFGGQGLPKSKSCNGPEWHNPSDPKPYIPVPEPSTPKEYTLGCDHETLRTYIQLATLISPCSEIIRTRLVVLLGLRVVLAR